MKSVIEITLIGLIGTLTLMGGILMPSIIVKTTLDKESVTNYEHNKAQHGLLTLFYSSQGSQSAYEILSHRALFENLTCSVNSDCPEGYECKSDMCKSKTTTKPLKDRLDKAMGAGEYCITAGDFVESASPSSTEILSKACPSGIAEFSALIVVPYNKNSPPAKNPLIKLIGIGVG